MHSVGLGVCKRAQLACQTRFHSSPSKNPTAPAEPPKRNPSEKQVSSKAEEGHAPWMVTLRNFHKEDDQHPPDQGNLNGGLVANGGVAQKEPIKPKRPLSGQFLLFPCGCEEQRNWSGSGPFIARQALNRPK